MDFMEGEPLETLAAPGVPQARRDAVGTVLERLMFRSCSSSARCRPTRTSPTTCGNRTPARWCCGLRRDDAFRRGVRRGLRARITRSGDRGDPRPSRATRSRSAMQRPRSAPRSRPPPTSSCWCANRCAPRRYDFAASDLPSALSRRGLRPGFRQACCGCHTGRCSCTASVVGSCSSRWRHRRARRRARWCDRCSSAGRPAEGREARRSGGRCLPQWRRRRPSARPASRARGSTPWRLRHVAGGHEVGALEAEPKTLYEPGAYVASQLGVQFAKNAYESRNTFIGKTLGIADTSGARSSSP